MSELLIKGAPGESIGKAQWFEHCADYVKPTQASLVLLLLDGHFSHTMNIELPGNPNVAASLQQTIEACDIAELLGKAYRKCQTGDITTTGFSVGGLYSFNRYISTKADYLTAFDESSGDVSALVVPNQQEQHPN
ncbi:hypothetical protein ILUMI_11663 [Ignelater luminosus]|uniref:Uncharacterized protein n=1 Tax=Ignelater luminosus TaxID=2038154 RepID=A0A8K0D1Q6_IGNLU|nr:hypothetical protein ILUMI_11663 [Ignelater luminosus]